MLSRVDRPVPFPGSKEEREANWRAHNWWVLSDEEVLCAECDCKPWHAAAFYPCGEEPPRETVTVDSDSPFELHPSLRFLAGAL